MARTYRIRGIPLGWNANRLRTFLAESYRTEPQPIGSLACEIHGVSQTATVSFPDDLKLPHSQIRLPTSSQLSRPQVVTIDDDFLGITTLYSPPTENHKIDIIALSGLGGHAFGSFKERGGEHMWIRDSLPYDLVPGDSTSLSIGRVMTYGYDSIIHGSNSYQNLEDLAISLHNSLIVLTSVTSAADTKPIIFIAHSLGGLILKQMLILISKSERDEDFNFLNLVYGIAFFGVPHDGMDISSIVPMVTDAPNQYLVDSLSHINSQILGQLRREFHHVLGDKGNSEIICFYETKESPTAKKDIRGLWKLNGPNTVLVTKSSATHSRHWEDRPEHICAIDRTHSDMVKFGPQDHEYDKVLQRLLGLARRALVVPWRHAQHRHMDSHSSILVRRRLSDLQKTDGESQGVTDGMKETKSKICYHIPLTKNNRFTGRIAILNTLEEMLFTKESNRRAALVGLGGVGKTQIALHFAYQLKERQPDYSIFWVPLLSEQSATQAYMEIAKKLNLPKSNNNEDERDLVRRYLNSGMAGKWLLIVDNADNQELIFGAANKPGIEAYLPESDNGIVLLTTRSGQVGVDFAGSDVIEVEQMDPEEALHLFKRSLIRKQLLEDEALIKELLLCLTFLPLAITQAVAYLNQTRAPVQAYLKLLQGAEEDMAKLLGREFRDHTRYRDSRNAVGTTWLVSFDQIERSAPGTVHLLSFISCIEPKAIPRTILPQGDQEELEWAIGTLCSYSFLVRQNDSNTFDMHSLVHMATRGWLEMRGCKNIALNDTICHVAKIFPSSDSANRDLWREYLPHAMHLLYQVDEHKINDAYSLFHKVGKCLFADRQFKEAIRCYEKEYRWRRDRYSEDNKERLDSEIELATAYLNDHRLREAIEMFEHIVAVQKETLDEGDYNRLGSEHELARAYLNDRRIKEAIKIFEHIVTVHKKTLDEKNYGRLASERELARAYLDDRRIKEAIKIFEHVMAIRKGILDEKDYKRLTSEHELARAYLNDRRIKEAIKILEHVVAVGKETLDERDYSRLASEHELARAYLDDRQIEEAIKMLEPIVAIGKKTLAKSNQIRLATEFTLARAYLDNRRITMATHILEHVVAVGKETFDKKDHIRLMFEHELARAYLDNQQNKEAIKMLEYIVVFRKEMLDERDYHRLVSEHELARAYLNNHQVKEAIKILEHIVPIGKETLNERDHIRLALEHTLARAYLDNRRIKEAIQILKHVVAIRKETLVERDYSRLTSERMLARAYLDGGDNERAIILLEHVVKIEPELLTDSDPERQLSSSLLADAQERLKSKELRE